MNRRHVCLVRLDDCAAHERDRVLRAWAAELIKDGYCVTPSLQIDGHGKYVKRNGNNEFVCSFCHKPV